MSLEMRAVNWLAAHAFGAAYELSELGLECACGADRRATDGAVLTEILMEKE